MNPINFEITKTVSDIYDQERLSSKYDCSADESDSLGKARCMLLNAGLSYDFEWRNKNENSKQVELQRVIPHRRRKDTKDQRTNQIDGFDSDQQKE